MKTSKADTWFSRFIRLRDATESNGVLVNKCFTCGKLGQAKNMDNSHFEPRTHKSTRYSEINCQPACKVCNWILEGNKVEYAKLLDKKYGEGTADKLKVQARIVTKVDENLIAMYYKEAVNNLLAEKKWKHLKWWS